MHKLPDSLAARGGFMTQSGFKMHMELLGESFPYHIKRQSLTRRFLLSACNVKSTLKV